MPEVTNESAVHYLVHWSRLRMPDLPPVLEVQVSVENIDKIIVVLQAEGLLLGRAFRYQQRTPFIPLSEQGEKTVVDFRTRWKNAEAQGS